MVRSICFSSPPPPPTPLFLFSLFCKTLVGSVKYISVWVGSGIWNQCDSLWLLICCVLPLYTCLLNFHFNFLAGYCGVTYFLILAEAPPDSWKVFPWFIVGSLSMCTYISNIVSPWQSKIREPFGISHHVFLHVSDLPGSRLRWEVVWWWCQRREHQSWQRFRCGRIFRRDLQSRYS